MKKVHTTQQQRRKGPACRNLTNRRWQCQLAAMYPPRVAKVPPWAANRRWGCRLAAVAVLILAAVPYARAQVQVQTGQALDANNQVGSGGSNNPIPGYVPLNPNIYGMMNSGGMPVPYQPQINYRVVPVPLPGGGTSYARIPEISQFSFSQPISPAAMQLSRISALSAGASNVSINEAVNGQFNWNSNGSLGQNTLGEQGYSTLPNNWAGLNVSNPFFPANAVAPYLNNPGVAPPVGTIGQVSPLFGLRQIPIQHPLYNVAPTGAFSQRIAPEKASPAGGQRIGKTARPSDFTVQGMVRVNPINNRVEAGTSQGGIGRPIRGLTGGALPGKNAVSGDLYQELLSELASGKKISVRGPGLAGKPAMTLTTLAPENPQSIRILKIDPFTGLPIAPVTARRSAGGQSTSDRSLSARGRTGRTSPTASLNIPRSLTRALRAGRRVEPLSSLAAPLPDEFNRTMQKAQVYLKQGHFIEAIEAYQGATLLQPVNQLPIIGQANAEIAAELYSSALYNLKFVFRRHPELTAVRYNLNALLPKVSILNAHRQLAAMVSHKNNAAAFLLSYLDYQLGQQTQLKRVLREWDGWKTGGIWPAVLAKAWLVPSASRHTSHGLEK